MRYRKVKKLLSVLITINNFVIYSHLLSLLSIFLAILAVDTADDGQISPEAFMVSLWGCLATITVLHTASRRKNSWANWLWKRN